MPSNGRVIVGCTHGEEDPDRVVVSYLTAGAALDEGKEVVMWLASDGVRLALRGLRRPHPRRPGAAGQARA
jgi:predicted peroxiredoxin